MTSTRWQRVKAIFDAACEIDPAARSGYIAAAANGDPEMIAEVESLLESLARAGNFIEPLEIPRAAPSDYGIGANIGPYRIVQTIGEGGMGTVYQAVRVDDLYRKLVALKVIRRGVFDSLARRRFDTERQILAHLDHPNIAKLLDGGATPDGRPYFVMDFIAGTPIDQYCDNLRLSIRERLKLFLTVCSAVEYAHENFVVHRDIKPGNILVTPDGQVKLLDFGIARLLDPDTLVSEETGAFPPMMTPEFASPEQLRNLPATAASDTWSLGVLLFLLLTGERPFVFAPAADPGTDEAVRDAAPRPASETAAGHDQAARARNSTPDRLQRELAGDLDSILLMALRTEPERRYRSVAALASDIENHLTSFPVSAREPTWRYRGAKFFRRHRAAVVAASLGILALTGGTITTAWEAHVAERERERAERRFSDLRRVANSLLFEMDGALRDVAGAGPARRILIERAVSFFDNLARDAAGDPELERELGSAYERAGDIESQSNNPAAASTYRKAIRMRENAASALPGNADLERDLISNYSKLSDAAWARGDIAAAVEYAGKGLRVSKALAGASGASKLDRIRLAADYLDYGYKLAFFAGQRDRGIENCREAVRIFELLAEEKPVDARLRRIAAAACDRTAELLEQDAATRDEAGSLRRSATALRTRAPEF